MMTAAGVGAFTYDPAYVTAHLLMRSSLATEPKKRLIRQLAH